MSRDLRKLIFVLLLVFFEIPYTYAVSEKDKKDKKKGNDDEPLAKENKRDKKDKKKGNDDEPLAKENKKDKKDKKKGNDDESLAKENKRDKKDKKKGNDDEPLAKENKKDKKDKKKGNDDEPLAKENKKDKKDKKKGDDDEPLAKENKRDKKDKKKGNDDESLAKENKRDKKDKKKGDDDEPLAKENKKDKKDKKKGNDDEPLAKENKKDKKDKKKGDDDEPLAKENKKDKKDKKKGNDDEPLAKENKKDKKDKKKNSDDDVTESEASGGKVDSKDSKSVGDKGAESAVVDDAATEEKEGKKKKGKKNKKDKNKSHSEDNEIEKKSASKSEKRKRKKGSKNKSIEDDDKIQEPDEEVRTFNKDDYLAALSACVNRFIGHSENESSDIRSGMTDANRLVYDSLYAQYDKNGKAIPLHDVQFKKTLIRQVILTDKVNSPLFHRGKEVTSFILSAVEKGDLVAYNDSNFEHEYTVEEFRNQYVRPKDVADGGADFDENITNEKEYFTPHEMSILELGINWIYDKNSSSFSEDIIFLCVIIPENYFKTGLRKEVAYLKYRDFIKYLKTVKTAAVWVNDENEVGDVSMEEIFEIKKYKSLVLRIGKYHNVIDNFETKENDKTSQYREGERSMKKFEASVDSV